MALKEYYWTFEQTEAATMWEVNNVPEGALHPAITEVFATGGYIIQPDSQLVAPYGLQLVFGVTPVSGIAMGKYYLDETTTDITSSANNVSITITQNGGTDPVGSTF
jgi:hypothetical protein